MPCLLALDQGTTSSRAVLFDTRGEILAQAQRELPQSFPAPGEVEHDPERIWADQLAVARQALQEAGRHAARVAAIGVSNQRETTVLWERATGRPVHNAIVWQDRRTTAFCEQLKAQDHEAEVRQRTGLRLDPYFSASKLAWLLDHVAGARARARRGELAFGTIDSWLLWKLSGGRRHLTDISNASRTGLLNIHSGAWDETLLALYDIPHEVLPEVVRSSACHAETAVELFGRPIVIGALVGDQQAASFGQGCLQAGQAKNTYGTGCFLLMHSGAQAVASRHGLLTTRAAQTGSQAGFALEGSVFVAGAAVQWLRDGLGLIRSAADIEPLAATVADSAGVVFVPAFSGLGTPYWAPQARGSLLGLSRGSSAGHIARATLEAIAFQNVELVRAMEADSGLTLSELRVDGGAAANDLLLQIQADLLGITVRRPRLLETTAWGAASLAGLALGVWSAAEDIAGLNPPEQDFEPTLPRAQTEERLATWQRAVRAALTFATPQAGSG